MEKLSKEYGAIRLQKVAKKLGAWKWASSRVSFRIVRSPYMSRGAINRLRSGEKVVWESDDVCMDYPGGYWGYGEELKEAQRVFKNTFFTK